MIEKIIEGIFNLKKIPAKFIVVICAVSAVLLFAPETFISKLNLAKFNDEYGSYIGIIFLLSGGFTLIAILTSIYYQVRGYLLKRKIKRMVDESLLSLTFHEQAVLREFFISGKDVIELPFHDPVVVSLLNKHIVFQVSGSGLVKYGDAFFSCRITDYARKGMTYETISLPRNNDKTSTEWVFNNRPTWAKRQQQHDDMMNMW